MLIKEILRFSFILNFSFLILHEMDAVFWKEWRIFGIADDIIGKRVFLAAHIPLIFIILLCMMNLEISSGKIMSLIFSSFLILHFFLHLNALKKNYFNEPFSFGIIICILVFSIIQFIATLLSMKNFYMRGI